MIFWEVISWPAPTWNKDAAAFSATKCTEDLFIYGLLDSQEALRIFGTVLSIVWQTLTMCPSPSYTRHLTPTLTNSTVFFISYVSTVCTKEIPLGQHIKLPQMPATKGPKLRKASFLLNFPIMFLLELYFLNNNWFLENRRKGKWKTA